MKAKVGIGIAIFVAVLVTCLQYITQAGSSDQILSSLCQANATIFALAFTIPIVAAQLSRYFSARRLLKKWSMIYMILYLITVFFPIMISQGDTLQISLAFFLSGFCGGLVIYYFAYVEDQLTPHMQLQNAAESITHTPNAWKTAESQILYIIFRALEQRDYDVYQEGLKRYSSIIKFAFRHLDLKAKTKVANSFEEIGFRVITDYTGLRFFCDELGKLAEELRELKNQYSWDLAMSWRTRILISLVKARPVGLHPLRTLLETYISDVIHGDEPTKKFLQTVEDDISGIFGAKYVPKQDLNGVFESLEAKYKMAHMKSKLTVLKGLRKAAITLERKS